jgi:hypothetical protein
MSIFSSIAAEHHREIIGKVIAEAKLKVTNRHPDADLTQGEVVTLLNKVLSECEAQIQE